MMKLYYSAGSCSTSCHISLEESGLPYEAISVDWDNPADPNLEVVTRLNPLGTLPILVTDNGCQLDQNLSIHTCIAEQAPGKKLLPPPGTPERLEALNWLSYVAADLHKSFGAFFYLRAISDDPAVQATVRKFHLGRVKTQLEYLESKLAGRTYLMGSAFTGADAYAFVVLGWAPHLEISLAPYPNVQAYVARVGARPAVMKVLKDEGLA